MACYQLCAGAGGGRGVMGLPLHQAAIALGKRRRKGVGLWAGLEAQGLNRQGEWERQAARDKARLWIT